MQEPEQADDVSLTADPNCPAAHWVQEAWPATENVPATHWPPLGAPTADVEPAGQKKPAVHEPEHVEDVRATVAPN